MTFNSSRPRLCIPCGISFHCVYACLYLNQQAFAEAETLLSAAGQQLCQHLSALAQGQTAIAADATQNPPATVQPLSAVVSPSAAVELDIAAPVLTISDTVRVKLIKLDELIKLMGELNASHTGMHELVGRARRLEQQSQAQVGAELMQGLRQFTRDIRDLVVSQDSLMQELHDKALQMRMLPLSIVLDTAAHFVRDMARSLGKQVDCRIYGSEIELDRQMIDQLADPIIHLLRNALDHGIETPAQRTQAGKSPQGLLHIRARQDSGWVVLDIRDDGAGLPLAAIRDKVLKKGLVSQAELQDMNDQQVADLIFMPGFSTSAIITDVSGRGVGLDVVKRSIVDQLQGIVSIDTVAGEGTCFTLRLPLSLAMMRVLLIRSGAQVLGFTAQYVTELLSVEPSALIHVADRNAVIIRNEFVPVVNLAQLLDLPQETRFKRPAQHDTATILLLVVRVHTEKLALQVTCTFSAGISLYPDYTHAEILRLAADAALYQAKRNGRNQVVMSEGEYE